MERNIPKTMAAVLLTGHGGPEKLVYRTDVPVPHPQPDEVLIRVHACGMNNTDIKVRIAEYIANFDPNGSRDHQEAAASISAIGGETSLTFPRIQGADIAGEIVAVGRDVPPERIGERVLVDFSIYKAVDEEGRLTMDLADVDYIGHGRDGGYAEYAAVPAANAHRITADITDEELATFGCSTLTAEHMLARLNIGPGDKVLITGAGGGVGSAAVQLARIRGAIPYAVTSRGKEEKLRALGAEACILREEFTTPGPVVPSSPTPPATPSAPSFDGAAFVAAVEKATGAPFSIDAVFDQVGGVMLHSLLQTLRPGGNYISAGTIAGYTPRINMHTLYMRFLSLRGSSQGMPEDFRRIVAAINDGRLRPVLGGVHPLSRLRDAQAAFQTKKHIGNLVIVPDALLNV